MTNYTISELSHIINTTSYVNQSQTFSYYANLYSEVRNIKVIQKTIITIRRYVSILINVL